MRSLLPVHLSGLPVRPGTAHRGRASRHSIPVLPQNISKHLCAIPHRPVQRLGDVFVKLPEIPGIHRILNDLLHFVTEIVPILISHIMPPFFYVDTWNHYNGIP